MPELVLKKPRQWQALFSPVRLEIVGHLELYGPSSVAEIARELGRTPHALYHHFRKLVEVGIIRVETTRQAGTREEAVYSVCGQPVIVRFEPNTTRTRELRVKAAAHHLRQAIRDYERSVECVDQESEQPEQPELRRYRMRLAPASATKIRDHLDAIMAVILSERLTASQISQDSRWYTWTSMLAPQEKCDVADGAG